MAKIIWADPAIQDLDAIADYIALDKPAAAHHLIQLVFAAVQMLRKFPQMGSLPAELSGLPYRQLLFLPAVFSIALRKRPSTSFIFCEDSNSFEENYFFLNRAYRISQQAGSDRPHKARWLAQGG